MTDWLAHTRTSYDTVATSYGDQLRDRLESEPHLRALLALFAELTAPGPAADVGCGPGWITAHLRDVGAFGIDLSPEMIAYARRAHPGVRFAVGSMTALPLPDASVSGVHIRRRTPAAFSARLRTAGFTIESETLLNPDDRVPGAVVIARAPA